uniref:Exocyst complex component 2 n=1 Tax=Sphaerodactylus townsendi TaxID=933632 RepID=A0ACB8FCN0_9SAUR
MLAHSPMLDLDTEVRPSSLGHLSRSASLKRGSSNQSSRDETWRFKAPQQVAFVEKLTKLVVSQLPNFWKLWISYVNGSLFSETAEKSGQMERSKKNARQRQNDFKTMIQQVMKSLVKLIRGALLPFSLGENELREYGGWEMKSELSGQWLPHVIQTVRIRIMITLQHTAEDVKRLAEKEDWVVDNEGLTGLPSQFEECVKRSLQSLKGVVDCKPGETSVFQHQKIQEDVCQLSINIMQVFIDCLEQLSTKPDSDLDTTQLYPECSEQFVTINIFGKTLSLSADVSSPDLFGSIHEDSSLSLERRLLIVLSNLCYLERHTFVNLAEHFEKHGFQGVEKITQVSKDSLKELDQRLFEMYIELKADPIVGSLEPGIYAGYFDWKDCLTPTVTLLYNT